MSDETVLNVAFPDVNATYWVLPYALGPGDSIELSGNYTAARYFSLNTYDTNFDTIDTLRDNMIVPDSGSGNRSGMRRPGAFLRRSGSGTPPSSRVRRTTRATRFRLCLPARARRRVS